MRAASSAQEPSRRPAVHRHRRRHDAAHEHGLAARREAVLRERAEGAKARAGRVVARRDGRRGLDGRFEVLQGRVRRESARALAHRRRREKERRGTDRLLALAVHVLERVLPRPLGLEALVVLVQLQRRPGVLDRVVRVGLDRRVEHGVGEEPQRELALPRGEVVDVDRVDDLVRRDVDVCAATECVRGRSTQS